jgi:hypothetical protein
LNFSHFFANPQVPFFYLSKKTKFLQGNNMQSHIVPSSDAKNFDDSVVTPPSSPDPPTPRRGSNESSTARSDYGGVDEFTGKTGLSTRTLDVWHTHLNLLVTEARDNKPLYYMQNSALIPGTPDVTMHMGGEKTGSVVAVARFRPCSLKL